VPTKHRAVESRRQSLVQGRRALSDGHLPKVAPWRHSCSADPGSRRATKQSGKTRCKGATRYGDPCRSGRCC